MNRPRILRLLRIAVSAVCLVFCAAFLLLWVRSYSWFDWMAAPLPRSYVVEATTKPGRFNVLISGPAFRRNHWEFTSNPIPGDAPQRTLSKRQQTHFDWAVFLGRLHVAMPLWFPVIVTAALSATLGIRSYRFSLRTMLLATTFVAVVLGLAVAMR
jgi:hypothetical protein